MSFEKEKQNKKTCLSLLIKAQKNACKLPSSTRTIHTSE